MPSRQAEELAANYERGRQLRHIMAGGHELRRMRLSAGARRVSKPRGIDEAKRIC